MTEVYLIPRVQTRCTLPPGRTGRRTITRKALLSRKRGLALGRPSGTKYAANRYIFSIPSLALLLRFMQRTNHCGERKGGTNAKDHPESNHQRKRIKPVRCCIIRPLVMNCPWTVFPARVSEDRRRFDMGRNVGPRLSGVFSCVPRASALLAVLEKNKQHAQHSARMGFNGSRRGVMGISVWVVVVVSPSYLC